MLSARVFAVSAFLVALFCVILSVTAAPLAPADEGLIVKRETTNQSALESDSIPVSSDGGNLAQYNPTDDVPKNVTTGGNSGKGDGKGLKA